MKQETLEEAAIDYCDRFFGKDRTTHQWNNGYTTFINSAKWQQERSYSEEEVLDILDKRLLSIGIKIRERKYTKEWFEQFKKK